MEEENENLKIDTEIANMQGNTVIILGCSGIGKSTLTRMIDMLEALDIHVECEEERNDLTGLLNEGTITRLEMSISEDDIFWDEIFKPKELLESMEEKKQTKIFITPSYEILQDEIFLGRAYSIPRGIEFCKEEEVLELLKQSSDYEDCDSKRDELVEKPMITDCEYWIHNRMRKSMLSTRWREYYCTQKRKAHLNDVLFFV